MDFDLILEFLACQSPFEGQKPPFLAKSGKLGAREKKKRFSLRASLSNFYNVLGENPFFRLKKGGPAIPKAGLSKQISTGFFLLGGVGGF